MKYLRTLLLFALEDAKSQVDESCYFLGVQVSCTFLFQGGSCQHAWKINDSGVAVMLRLWVKQALYMEMISSGHCSLLLS